MNTQLIGLKLRFAELASRYSALINSVNRISSIKYQPLFNFIKPF
jgi:hypothetical protein